MTGTITASSDESLVYAARAGDSAAYAALVNRYRRSAVAYAYAMLSNRDEAEDAAQEAFVRAYMALGGFRFNARWAPWFMRILRNHCADMLRSRKTRQRDLFQFNEQLMVDSPEVAALANVQTKILVNAVKLLPEKHRVPLLLHYSSRLSYREIAVTLSVPESTVVGRIATAVRELRRRLGVTRRHTS